MTLQPNEEHPLKESRVEVQRKRRYPEEEEKVPSTSKCRRDDKYSKSKSSSDKHSKSSSDECYKSKSSSDHYSKSKSSSDQYSKSKKSRKESPKKSKSFEKGDEETKDSQKPRKNKSTKEGAKACNGKEPIEREEDSPLMDLREEP